MIILNLKHRTLKAIGITIRIVRLLIIIIGSFLKYFPGIDPSFEKYVNPFILGILEI